MWKEHSENLRMCFTGLEMAPLSIPTTSNAHAKLQAQGDYLAIYWMNREG